MAEPRLVTIHESVVNYVYSEDSEVHNSRDWTGVISYDNARFFCLTLEVDDDENELPEVDYKNPPKFALSGGNYSFWNSKNVQAVNNTSMSFDIARNDSLFWVSNDLRQWGGDKPGYVPTNSEGDWIHFLNAADGGMSGVTVSWTFPEMYGLTGSSDTVPTMKTTNEQLADFVPYIEYVGTGVINQETGINKGIDGLNITGIKWRLVKSSDVDSPITLSDDIHIEIRNAFGENQESPSYENQKGYTLVSSGNVISGEISLGDDYGFFPYCTIVRYYIGDNKDEIYQWRFVSQNGAFLDNFGAVLGGGKGGTVSWVAGLKDGKADYTYVTYGGTDVSSVATWPVICEGKHLTDKGKLTIKGGGTFSIVDAEFGNVIQEFDTSEDIVLPLSTRSPLGGSMAEYSYSIEGYRKADWNYLSDAYSTRGVAFMDPTGSLSNKTVKWEFPEEVDAKGRLNGEGKIRNVKTLEQQFNTATGFFPYVELISDDEGNLKEVNYRIVRSPDISQAYNPGVVCYLDIFINCDGNQVTGPNVEQLTNADTSEFNSDNFESKFHIEGKWTPTNPVKFGTYHNVSVNLQVYEKLTKEEFEALGLDYGQFIGNANLFTPYTWIFTDYPPVAEIHFMNNSEFENVSTDSVAAAIDGFNATDNIQAVQREEVYEESGVDENVISYFENEDSELVGRFKQLYSESEGWVVTKVTLPDELYDNLQDVSADNLAVYSITDAELQEQAAISKHNNNFLNWFITPAFADSTTSKTGKLVNLDGSKLDKINSKELLMVSYLKAGQKSNMYLGFNASATPAPTPTPTPTPTPEPENENPESDPANESESGKNQTSTIETASGTISNGVFVTKAGNNKSIAEIIAELGANAASITGFVINNTAITKLTSA
ncbi:MAG: hypothetical protein IJP69_01165, partial [Synergistaceae bacterium]|nr:hypothetical protein [Synergistaceae bacterium]